MNKKGFLLLFISLLFFAVADWVVFSESRPGSDSFVLTSYALDASTSTTPVTGGSGDSSMSFHTIAVGQNVADGAVSTNPVDLNQPRVFARSVSENKLHMAVHGYSTFGDDVALQNIYNIFPGYTLAARKDTAVYFSIFTQGSGIETRGVSELNVRIASIATPNDYLYDGNWEHEATNFAPNSDFTIDHIHHNPMTQLPGYTFVFNKDVFWEVGQTYEVSINYLVAGAADWSVKTFSFQIAGVPFLTFIQDKTDGYEDTGYANPAAMTSKIYGMTLAGGHDLNGDGYDDLLVADPYFQYNFQDSKRKGIVYLYYGSADQNMDKDIVFDNYFVDANNERSPEFGYEVKVADLNNDGYADVFIGHPAWGKNVSVPDPDPNDANKGRILVYLGGPNLLDGGSPLGGLSGSTPVLILEADIDRFGERFDVGDINGDGYADLLAIGKDTEDNYVAKVFDGSLIAAVIDFEKSFPLEETITPITFEVGGLSAESKIKIVGDVDKDGLDDFVITMPDMDAYQAEAKLYRGQNNFTDLEPSTVFKDPTYESNFFGFSVTGGDINGDGNADIVIGTKRPPRQMKLVLAQFTAGSPQTNFSIQSRDTGDFLLKADDPFLEIVFSDRDDLEANTNFQGISIERQDFAKELFGKILLGTSKVFIFYGLTNMPNAYADLDDPPIDIIDDPYKILSGGTDYGSQFGYEVSIVGDVDGDGIDDLFIGAPDIGEGNLGGVFIVLGNDHRVDEDFAPSNFNSYFIPGEDYMGHLGYSIPAVGDLDGDTYNDVIISNPGFDGSAYDFNGYPIGYINAAPKHNIHHYGNMLAVDRASPALVQASPAHGQVGWDLDDDMKFTIVDRGKSGIKLETLALTYRREGFSTFEDYLILPNNNNLVARKSNLEIYQINEDGTRVAVNYSNFTPPDPRPKKYEIIISPNHGVLEESEKYELVFDVEDAWEDPYDNFGGGAESNRMFATVNVGINQRIFAEVESDSIVGTRRGRYSSIGDINADGIGDMAFITNNREEVHVFLGKPGLDLNEPNFILWSEQDYYFTHITYGNFDNENTIDDLVVVQQSDSNAKKPKIGLLAGSKTYWNEISDAHVPRRIENYFLNNYASGTRVFNAASNDPGYKDEIVAIDTIRNKEKKAETLIYINRNHDSGEYELIQAKTDTGSIIAMKSRGVVPDYTPTNEPVRSLVTGYIYGSDQQDLVLGMPYYDDTVNPANTKTGKILIAETISINNGVRIIAQQEITGTKKDQYYGWSLASGYFNDEMNISGERGYYDDLNNKSSGWNPFAWEDLAVGSPGDSSYGYKAGKVQVYFSSGNIEEDKYVVLKPEIEGGFFGYSMAKVNYLAFPSHYKEWSAFGNFKDKEYFDNAEDLIVGSIGFMKDFNTFDSASVETIDNELTNGKAYIYVGGQNFTNVPMVGVVGKDDNQLGRTMDSLGDVLNTRADLIGMNKKDGPPKLAAMYNKMVPDTQPPAIIMMDPGNLEYDVSTDKKITIKVADQSGVTSSEISIFRRGNIYDYMLGNLAIGEDWEIMVNGQKQPKGTDYDIQLNRINAETFQITIEPTNNYKYNLLSNDNEWGFGETVGFKMSIGDQRTVWVNNNLRSYDPLYNNFEYGFVADFKDTVITGNAIFGEDTSNSLFGSSVATLGDINGDGLVDFIVGEPGSSVSGFNSGKAYVYLGGTNFTAVTDEDAVLYLDPRDFPETYWSSAKFGWKVAGAGDVNRDGFDDAVVVAANSNSKGGEVFLLYGNSNIDDPHNSDGTYWEPYALHTAATSIQAEQIGDQFGYTLGTGGDVNGDGYADLVIGAPAHDYGTTVNVGKVYIIFGGPHMKEMWYSRANGAVYPQGPIKVEYLRQLEYDPVLGGYEFPDDFEISRDEPGIALLAPSINAHLRFGSSLINDININGDTQVISWPTPVNAEATRNVNIDEVVIGSTGHDRDRGRVEIYQFVSGSNHQLLRKTEIKGEKIGDRFGFSMASLGDISADNNFGNTDDPICEDFVVGAPYSQGANPKDNPKYLSGAAYVYLGDQFFNIVTPEMQTYGQNSGDQFGYKVANIGNVDNDDYNNNDILVAAPFFNKNYKDPNLIQRDTGRVYIFATPLIVDTKGTGDPADDEYFPFLDPYADFIARGENENDRFGISAAFIGDVDGDFVQEYVIGAPNRSSGINSSIGKAYLFTNPDTIPPQLVTSSLVPFDGQRGWDFTFKGTEEGEVVDIINPISFKIRDDRVLDLTSVMLKITDKTINDSRVYSAWYKQDGDQHSFTVRSAKEADFNFVPRFREDIGLEYEAAYEAQVFAQDKAGNILDPSISKFFFTTTTDPKAAPKGYIIFYDDGTDLTNVITSDSPTMDLDISDNYTAGGKIRQYRIDAPAPWIGASAQWIGGLFPLQLGVTVDVNVDRYYFPGWAGVTTDLAQEGPNTLIATFVDNEHERSGYTNPDNVLVKKVTVYKDTEAPQVSSIYPAHTATGNADDLDVVLTISDTGLGISLNSVYLVIDGDKGTRSWENIPLGLFDDYSDSEVRLLSQPDYASAPSGKADWVPSVVVTINGMVFQYEENVSISVWAVDNTGRSDHRLLGWDSGLGTGNFTYQVSPDYRPPVPYRNLIINEGEQYTTGDIFVKVAAFDDTGVEQIQIMVGEGATFKESGTNSIFIPFDSLEDLEPLRVGETASSRSFRVSLNMFTIDGGDGVYTITVNYFDSYGNKSKDHAASIILDANSAYGGPIMPTILVNAYTLGDMVYYLNTTNITLNMYAVDVQDEEDEFNPGVSGVIVYTKDETQVLDPRDRKFIKWFPDANPFYAPEGPIAFANQSIRGRIKTFLQYQNFRLDPATEGEVSINAVFYDNDYDYIDEDDFVFGWPRNVVVAPFGTTYLDGKGRVVNYKIMTDMEGTIADDDLMANMNMSDTQASVTFFIDKTRPTLNFVMALSGGTTDMAYSIYGRELRLSALFDDKNDFPLSEFGYRLFAYNVTNNALMHVGYNDLESKFNDFKYILPVDEYWANLNPSNNMVTINGTSNDEGYIRIHKSNVLADDYHKYYADQTDLELWQTVELNDTDRSIDKMVVEADVTTNMRGFFFAGYVKDRAGNYSAIVTSNLAGKDNISPKTPKYNYTDRVKINKPRFDIDFEDTNAGISSILVAFNSASAARRPIESDTSFATSATLNVNYSDNFPVGSVVSYDCGVNIFDRNWQLREADWNTLPEGKHKLFFRLKDAANNVWQAEATDYYEFEKDTTPIAPQTLYLEIDGSNDKRVVTKNYYNVHHQLQGALPDKFTGLFSLAEIVTANFPKDYSFEDAGYYGVKMPKNFWHVTVNDPAEDMLLNQHVTSSVLLLEYEVNNQPVYPASNHGLYGLTVSFDIGSAPEEESSWQWGGLQTTFNVGQFISSRDVYSVAMLVHTEDLTKELDGDTRLVLRLQRGANTVYSNPITKFVKQDNSFNAIYAGITGNSRTVTATLQFVNNTNYNLMTFGNRDPEPTARITGNLYIDAVFTQPGILIVTNNMKNLDGSNKLTFRMDFEDTPGAKDLYFMLFDKPGNVSTGSYQLGYDQSAPVYVGSEPVTPNRGDVPWAVGIDDHNKDAIYFGSNEYLGLLAKYEEDHYSRIDYYGYQLWAVSPSVTKLNLSGEVVVDDLGGTRWRLAAPNVMATHNYMYLKIDDAFPALRNDGQFVFRINAHNEADLWGTPVTADVTYNIDIEPPIMDIEIEPSMQEYYGAELRSSGWYSGTINVTVNAADYLNKNYYNPEWPPIYEIGGTGVRSIWYQVNTGDIKISHVVSTNCVPWSTPTLDVGPPTKTVTFQLGNEGKNYFAVTANDALGNKDLYSYQDEILPNGWSWNMLNIDRIPPQVDVTVSVDTGEPYILQSDLTTTNGWSSRNVEFRIGFSDGPGSGTRYVYYQIDGGQTVTVPITSDPLGNPAIPKMTINWAQADIPVTDELLEFVSNNQSTLVTPGYTYDENTGATTLRRVMTDPERDQLYSYYPSPNEILRDETARIEIDKLYERSQSGISKVEIKEGYFDNLGVPRRSAIRDKLSDELVSTPDAGNYIPHFFKYDSFKFYDGYHQINVWAEDRIGHTGAVEEAKFVKVDRKAPETMFDMGGNFQVEWSLATVNVNVRVYDLFNAQVFVTSDYYTVIPAGREGTYTDLPGSGVNQFWYKVDANNPDPDSLSGTWKLVTNDYLEGRWGLNVGNYPDIAGDGYFVHPEPIIVSTNGLNTVQFFAEDFAGVGSPLVYENPANKVWDALLNMYIYPADKGIVRDIKVDTLPPYDAGITVNIPSDDIYYLYTNQPDLQITVSAKDDGIGVRYAYIWCSENSTIGEFRGLKNSPAPTAPYYVNYYPTEGWSTISYMEAKPVGAQVLNAGIDLPLDGTNGVWLRFGDIQGTRNIHVLYADDFGMDYKVTQSFIEVDGGDPFWGFTPATMNNYSATPVTLQDGSDATIHTWYIVKPARLDHRVATEDRGSMMVVYDNILDPGEMWMTAATGDYITTRDIVTGELELLADSIFTGRDRSNRNMHTTTVNGSSQLIILRESLTPYQELFVSHDLENELSGIRKVRVRGNIKDTADTYAWLDFKDLWNGYPKDTVNTLSVQIDEAQEDGYKTIMADFIDIAGNHGGVTNFNFLYDKIMEFDNPLNRIDIFEYDELGEKVNKDYILTTKSINVKLNFPGAWAYRVSGDIEGGAIVTGHYLESGSSFNVTLDATTGGEKTIYLTMVDLFFDSDPITINVFLDQEIDRATANISLMGTAHPVVSILGQQCFYQGEKLIQLMLSGVTGNTLSGVQEIYIDGTDINGSNQCLDTINDGRKWLTFNPMADNYYNVNLLDSIVDSIVTINIRLKDVLGNTTQYQTYLQLYFDQGMETSDPLSRITIRSILDGQKIKHLVDSANIRVYLDFPGATSANVSGDIIGGVVSKGYDSRINDNYIDVELLPSENFLDRTIYITMQDLFLNDAGTPADPLDDTLVGIEAGPITINLMDVGYDDLTPNFEILSVPELRITYDSVVQTVNYVDIDDQIIRVITANNSYLFGMQTTGVTMPVSIRVTGNAVQKTVPIEYFITNSTSDFTIKLAPYERDGFITVNVAISDGLGWSKPTAYRLFYDYPIVTDNYLSRVKYYSNETGSTLSYIVDTANIKIEMDFPGTYRYRVTGDIETEVTGDYQVFETNSFNITLLPGVGEKDIVLDLIDYGYSKRITLNLLIPETDDKASGAVSRNISFQDALRITFNSVLTDFVDKDDQILVVSPDSEVSLVGVKDLYIYGDVLAGENTFTWVSYNTGTVNTYNIMLDSSDISVISNGYVTVNVILRDAMGLTSNAALLAPLYDMAMQADDPRSRIGLQPFVIRKNFGMPAWLSDLDYLVNTDNLTFNVNFPGCNYYTVSGDIVGGAVSAGYAEDISFTVLPGEQRKTILISMHDMRSETGFITYNIGYDDKVLPGDVTINGIVQKNIFGTTVNYVNAQQQTLLVSHNVVDELSGIKHLMLTGNVEEGHIYSKQWIPFTYGVENSYGIRLQPPVNDGMITVNIIYKDYALNTNTQQNIEMFYDRVLQYNNPYTRFEVWSRESNTKKSYLIDSPEISLHLNFPGANHYRIEGDIDDADGVVTGSYSQIVDVDLTPTEGIKNIYLTLIDTTFESMPITINMLMDSIAPSITINSIQKDVWYYNNKPFGIQAVEHVPTEDGAISSGVHNIYYRYNGGQTYRYEVANLNQITINTTATLNVSGTNNVIEVWVDDWNGNVSDHLFFDGVKLNVNPPAVYDVNLLSGSNNHVKDSNIQLQINAIGSDRYEATGDLDAPAAGAYNGVDAPISLVLDSSSQGTKNVQLVMKDAYTADGSRAATVDLEIIYDSTPPIAPFVENPGDFSTTFNVIPADMYIEGSNLPNDAYRTKVEVRVGYGAYSDAEIVDADSWRVRMQDFVYRGGTQILLRFRAYDDAGNYSSVVEKTLKLGNSLIIGQLAGNISTINMTSVDKDDFRVVLATSKLSGINESEKLDTGIVDIVALDSMGDQVHDFSADPSANTMIVLRYPSDIESQGIDPDTLKIFYLNESTNEWELVEGEQVIDKLSRTVSVEVEHFSIYRLFSVVDFASDLDAVRVFPNPYIGNDGVAENGEDSDPLRNMVKFENLTSSSVIRIYTISGELVDRFEVSSASQDWHLKNMNDARIASGIYIYLITDDKGNSKRGRITVVR